MFGAMTNDFLKVSSYIHAVSSFEQTKPIRGCDKLYHGVPLRRSRRNSDAYKLTRPLEDGPVTAWMYNTPIFVVSPDDKIVVTPYNSVTTRKVLNYLLPWDFSLCTFQGKQVLHIRPDQSHYIEREFTIDLKNKQVHGLEAVAVRRVDRRAARAAMKPYAKHVETYKLWCSIFTKESADTFLKSRDTDRWNIAIAASRGALDLNDVDMWILMAAADVKTYWGHNLAVFDHARRTIYANAGVHYDENLEPGTLHRNAQYRNEQYSTTY